MTLADRFPIYRDCRIVLDTLLEADEWPAEYVLSTSGEALNWRLRANRLRAEIRKLDKRIHGKLTGESPYDSLTLTVDDTTVIIDKRAPTGVIRAGGKALEPKLPEEAPPEAEDDFELGEDIDL